MKQFRYDLSGNWYKGNTHIHSVASDGGKTFAELSSMYASVGYDFLFRTDHWVCSDAESDGSVYPLLWMDGIELDGNHKGSLYHVVCLGMVEGIRREEGFLTGLEQAREQEAVLILAHPQWCGNTMSDVHELKFQGVEVYNHVCRWLNGKGEGLAYWNAALDRNAISLGFAVDDAHLSSAHPGWNGGWIMVNASELSRPSLMDAIRRGNFYSTCGPEFHDISLDDGEISLECTPVKFIRLVGPGPLGERVGSFDDATLTHARFTVPADWKYVYLEIEDANGNRAWTNNLIVADPTN